jgi:SAM-dependent methyltransferase
VSKVTSESLTKRHEVSLPKNLISECSVLDLGSCYGATGHWCLANGASHYTGVEIQKDMVDKSNQMLSKYWNNYTIIESGIDDFLNQNTQQYDVTILFGVMYAFLDQYGLLQRISKITNKIIIIDTIYPPKMVKISDAIIQIILNQHINSSKENTAYIGVGSRCSPEALNIMMNTLGFENTEGVLYPNCLLDTTVADSYNTIVAKGKNKNHVKYPLRYISRFTKSNNITKIVSDIVKNNDYTESSAMHEKPNIMWNAHWSFDSSVANRYEKEVAAHIPDYTRVIELCIDCVNANFNKDVNVIDVGSAKGNTIDKFLASGFLNVYGVESSQAMYDASKHQDRVTLSNTFVAGEWDVVLANWTLHFINERHQYLKDIYDNMTDNGLLILTDKMSFTEDIERLYYDFKKFNGISEDEIELKRKLLIGVLTTKSYQWYTDTLKTIGFRDIQIINANMMFNTLYARK